MGIIKLEWKVCGVLNSDKKCFLIRILYLHLERNNISISTNVVMWNCFHQNAKKKNEILNIWSRSSFFFCFLFLEFLCSSRGKPFLKVYCTSNLWKRIFSSYSYFMLFLKFDVCSLLVRTTHISLKYMVFIIFARNTFFYTYARF